MTDKVKATLQKYQMIEKKDTIVVAVSGGADSMSLLHLLFSLKEELGISVAAAHVNHGLRGEEADQDEEFVCKWCEERKIPFFIHRADIRALAEQEKIGLEECGRRVRYAFFEQVAKKYPQAKIATAHTLSDQAETFFMRLVRGAGTSGLCAIPPQRGNIIRPLLETTRQEVEGYCKEHQIDFCTDKTNFQTQYTRNKIRRLVLPFLKEINPQLEETIKGTIEQLRSEEEFLEKEANAAWEKACKDDGACILKLRDLPDALLSRAVRRVAPCCPMERRHIQKLMELARGAAGAEVLPGNIKVAVKDGVLAVQKEKTEKKPVCISLFAAQSQKEGAYGLTFEIVSRETFVFRLKFYKLLFNNALSYDTITDSTVLRNRRPGDSFKKAGRKVTKTVKKLFCEEGIPCEQRDSLLMLANESEILWIQGLGVSESAKVTEETKQVLLILSEECRDVK